MCHSEPTRHPTPLARPSARKRRFRRSIRPRRLGMLLGLLLGVCFVAAAPRSAQAERQPSAALRGQPGPLVSASLTHQERKRTYHVQAPRDHDRKRPVPLVLALHGGGGHGKQLAEARGVDLGAKANRRGWVVVYPDGIAKGWNDGRTLDDRRGRQRRGVDDVGFLSQLIEVLHQRYGIDRQRVYATGISNGGFMSLRLGVDLAAKIAAIAPVTASLQVVHQAKRPTHPVSVLLVNGTRDPLVPFEGGQVSLFGRKRGAILSTDATVVWWARHNACTTIVPRKALPNRAPLDGTRVYREVRAGGAAGSEVQLLRVERGGHTWPGSRPTALAPIVGRTSRDISATDEILAFFARHHRVLTTPAVTKPAVADPAAAKPAAAKPAVTTGR